MAGCDGANRHYLGTGRNWRIEKVSEVVEKAWWSQRDLNPCLSLERAIRGRNSTNRKLHINWAVFPSFLSFLVT